MFDAREQDFGHVGSKILIKLKVKRPQKVDVCGLLDKLEEKYLLKLNAKRLKKV